MYKRGDQFRFGSETQIDCERPPRPRRLADFRKDQMDRRGNIIPAGVSPTTGLMRFSDASVPVGDKGLQIDCDVALQVRSSILTGVFSFPFHCLTHASHQIPIQSDGTNESR